MISNPITSYTRYGFPDAVSEAGDGQNLATAAILAGTVIGERIGAEK